MVNAFKPNSLAEALDIRAKDDVIPFAGGTDLMVRMRRWSGTSPEFEKSALFLGHLDELKIIEPTENGNLKIGSSCTLTQILESEFIPGILKEAVSNMASVAIRNVATIGGNVCNASPAGDTLPVLYALDAELILENMDGNRKVPIAEFIKGPGETELNDDEILREIILPIKDFDISYYRKVGTRKATALSKLSFLGLAKKYDAKIEDVRIAFGAVAPTIVRAREIELEIIGTCKTELPEKVDDIVDRFSRLIQPIDDQRSSARYRKDVSLKILKHFLTQEIP